MGSFLAYWLTCWGGLLLMVQPGQSADPQSELKESLLHRQSTTRSFYYKLAGAEFRPKGAIVPGFIPPHDNKAPLSAIWKVDFERNWVLSKKHFEAFNATAKKYLPRYSGIFFDGAVLKDFGPFLDTQQRVDSGYSDRMQTARVKTPDAADKTLWYKFTDLPLFYYHGVLLPQHQCPALPSFSTFKNPAPITFVGKDKIENVDCRVFSWQPDTTGEIKCWLDKTRNYSVLKIEEYGKGNQLLSRTTIQPQKAEWGFIPHKWEAVVYDKKGHVVGITTHEIEEFAINPVFDKADFEGDELKPGDVVKDQDQKQYLKVDTTRSLVPFIPGQQARRKIPIVLIAVGLFVVLSLLTVAVWIKRKGLMAIWKKQ